MSRTAVMDVQMWRAFLCLLAFDETKYARTIESFLPQVSKFRIEYDASLTGLGWVTSIRESNGDWKVIQFAGMVFPFDVHKDSSFQNTCEYLAVIAAVYALYLLGHQGFTYELIGDSMSSLKWSRAEYTKSSIARNASIGFSLLSIRVDANLNTTTHVAGVNNEVCDGLSRSLSFRHPSLNETLRVQNNFVESLSAFLCECDPTVSEAVASDEHIDLLKRLLSKLN
jgi:hypothetical protein